MSRKFWTGSLYRATLPALAVVLFPAVAAAQTGRITGTVTNQDRAPVEGAQVSVVGSRLGSLTNANGQFVVTGVPAGTHELRVHFTGYSTAIVPVAVAAGQAVAVEVQLEGMAIQLGGLVVSASRAPQRITDAPATITQIDPTVLERSAGNSWMSGLKQVVGLDFVQVGVASVAINARGFNSSFNNRMLMMEDGRVAVLPENGLPVGQFTALPKIDLAGVEVLVGPGAALYGADASNGVVTLLSKDPRQYPGTTVEVTGGSREYKNVQARQAGVFGDWGYKVTGEWQDAVDWENRIRSSAAATSPWEVSVGDTTGPNWNSSVVRGSGSLVRYMGDSRLELSAGASQTDGVGQTNVGRNQLVDWRYNFLQAKISTPGWFAQAYRTQSQSGDSYAINRFTDFRRHPAHASKSDEEIRLMADWPSNGQLYAVEVQNNFRVPALLNTRFVWGGQYRHDRVSSDRQWLSDRLTGEPLGIDQYGAYAQAEAPVAPWLDLVVAGRYDKHERYEAQFSPKAGAVLKPAEGHAFRVTYNRAFKSPTTLQTDFYIPDFIPGIGVFGNTDGFEIRNPDGAVVNSYAPLTPEENQTVEIGYKGILADRLFLDLTGYSARYENFLSPLSVISFPALGLIAYQKGQRVEDETGRAPIALTYFNLGTAKLQGVDAGVNFYVAQKVRLAGTLSLTDLKEIEGIDIRTVTGAADTARIREASVLNAPTTKWTIGAHADEFGHILGGRFFGGVTARHVNGYFFASGINKGTIPTFTTLDLNAGYEVPRFDNLLVNLGVSNLFTCRDSDPNEPTDTGKCGFGSDKRHIEMINMPAIGTMVFLGLRYHVQ